MRGPAGKPQGAVMNRLSVLGTGDLFRPYNGQDGKKQEQEDRAQVNQRQGARLGTMCANEIMLHREPGTRYTVDTQQIQSDSQT